MSCTSRKDFFFSSLMNLLRAFSTSWLIPKTDRLILSIFFSSSISLNWQSNFSSAVWSTSQILEQSSTKSAKSPKIYSSTKSFIFPSRSVSLPSVYLQLLDMQQAPISKKTAESASRTSLKRMTLHFDQRTCSMRILKLPTKKTISTGKASMVMVWYQYPSLMSNRKPTKPKQLATSVRKILSSRMQRLKIFHLSLQSRQVESREMQTVLKASAIDMYPLLASLVVKTRMMFWKEMQKVISRISKQMISGCYFLLLGVSGSLPEERLSMDWMLSFLESDFMDLTSSRPQKETILGEGSQRMLELASISMGLCRLTTWFLLMVEEFQIQYGPMEYQAVFQKY